MDFLDNWDLDSNRVILFTCSRSEEAILTLLDDDFNFECCLRLLSFKDQAKVRAVKHNGKEALLSRLFMKAVLNLVRCKLSGATLDLWQELEFEYSEHGKPELKGRPFAFNNSNSNDMACVVVLANPGSIGVDISHEEQDSISPESVVEQFHGIFSEHEKAQLERIGDVSERYFAFNHLWTLKEAFTKYLGSGLNIDLSSFSFEIEQLQGAVNTAQMSERAFTSYSIDWTECKGDFSSVKYNNWSADQPLHCYSTVLKKSHKLPVIASIIADSPERALGVHVDLYQLLKEEMHLN